MKQKINWEEKGILFLWEELDKLTMVVAKMSERIKLLDKLTKIGTLFGKDVLVNTIDEEELKIINKFISRMVKEYEEMCELKTKIELEKYD